jgi:formate dehydrogenase
MHHRRSDVVAVAPADAERDALVDGATVVVRSRTAAVRARVHVADDVRPGVAVMEHGWGSATYDPSTGTLRRRVGVNRNLLVADDDLDPLTGVPRLNGTPVRIERPA